MQFIQAANTIYQETLSNFMFNRAENSVQSSFL